MRQAASLRLGAGRGRLGEANVNSTLRPQQLCLMLYVFGNWASDNMFHKTQTRATCALFASWATHHLHIAENRIELFHDAGPGGIVLESLGRWEVAQLGRRGHHRQAAC